MKGIGCPDARVDTKDCMALRQAVKNVEFQAEHLQEDMLEQLAGPMSKESIPPAEQLSAAAYNLQCYFNDLDVGIEAKVGDHLARIMQAAFPQSSDEVKQALVC